jgi:hypothetical protein
LHQMSVKSLDWQNELRTPRLDQQRTSSMIVEIDKCVRENEAKLIELKKKLLNGKLSSFLKSKNIEFDETFFGERSNNRSSIVSTGAPRRGGKIKKSLAEKKNLGLEHSTILSMFQVQTLLKLCNFDPNTCKFSLVYRASQDGFGADEFHAKCDGVAKTLTIIKVKGNVNVFGGYTEASWDSSNNFKEDHNAFIFSLVNRENKPVKIMIKNTDFTDGSYCLISFQ